MRTVVMLLVVALVAGQAQSQQGGKMAQGKMAGGPARRTPAWNIQNAMSAAPLAIAKDATIMGWPAKAGDPPIQLRAGTNGWTCFPDLPDTKENDPMCLDKVWMKWVAAWQGKQPFKTDVAGVAYMLQGGGAMSETDPYAMTPPPGEHWTPDPPHLMFISPDPSSLAGLPDKKGTGGPWVMWKGTPYEHVMLPAK